MDGKKDKHTDIERIDMDIQTEGRTDRHENTLPLYTHLPAVVDIAAIHAKTISLSIIVIFVETP